MRRRLRQTPRWLVVRSGRRQPPRLVQAALAAGAHTVQEAEAAALRWELPRRLACAGRGVGRLGERRRDQAEEEGSGGAEEEENAQREEELAQGSKAGCDQEVVVDGCGPIGRSAPAGGGRRAGGKHEYLGVNF